MNDVLSNARNNAKLCAQTIKAELKQQWPTVKFSVRSRVLTTGDGSVDVLFSTPDLTLDQVYEVIGKYQSSDYRPASTPVSVRYVHAEHVSAEYLNDRARAMRESVDLAGQLVKSALKSGVPVGKHEERQLSDESKE